MTVPAELVKRHQRLEYFLAIEGVGWLYNGIHDASAGFAGTLWTTGNAASLPGELSGTVTPVVYAGLMLPGSISESIDPRNVQYSPGGLSLSVVDHDGWWTSNLTPRRAGDSTTLNSAIRYFDDTIRLTNGAAFAAGDLVWVAGRELIKLGTKFLVGGSIYDYTSSLRGYLGTQRGSVLHRPSDYSGGYWPAGASVAEVPWWWQNRQAALYAHVPGESGNAQIMWYGKMRSVVNDDCSGVLWDFSFVADFMTTMTRIHRPVEWDVSSDIGGVGDSIADREWIGMDGARSLVFHGPIDRRGADGTGAYELAGAYNYRYEPGGIEGMVSSWDAGGVQARDVGAHTDCLQSYVLVDGAAYYMSRKSPYGTDPTCVDARLIPYGGFNVDAVQWSPNNKYVGIEDSISLRFKSKARFLLDNVSDKKFVNRFTVNGRIVRHPIDVLLCFLLSMDHELYRADLVAGSTSTVLALTAFPFPVNALVGRAAMLMEGAQAGLARKIVSNTTSTITVERAFTGPPAAGFEVQIRNSIWDVLPFGWGLGIDCRLIDTKSFEIIRDSYMRDVTIGEFVIGSDDELDMLEFLIDAICKPYGVLMYFDTSTGKIAARYIGEAMPNGNFDTFVEINTEHVYDKGRLNFNFTNPIGTIELKVRESKERVVGITRESTGPGLGTANRAIMATKPSIVGGKTVTVRIKSDEANLAFSEHDLDTVHIEAALNTENDFAPLAGRLQGIASQYSVPPPVWDTLLDISLYPSLQMGVWVIINWADAPANPFTGQHGWTDLIGRVVARSYPISDSPSFDCTIELWGVVTVGRIAPATKVISKGSDAHGAYFVCAATESYVVDPDADKDWYFFAVGDRLEHRSSTGAPVAGWATRAITGFGGNFVSDPRSASSARIYVDTGIGSVVTIGDYVTFAAWSASNTARMERYSAYANASSALGGGDTARQYG